MNMSITFIAESPTHSLFMHSEINKLIKLTLPNYVQRNGSKQLSNPWSLVTIGDYIVDEPCVVTSVVVASDNDVPWDVDDYGQTWEVARKYDVDISFMILHKDIIDNTYSPIGSKRASDNELIGRDFGGLIKTINKWN